MYQAKFWKGQILRHHGPGDRIRPNPEAPAMNGGPGETDMSMGTGSDSPKLGSSQPRATANPSKDELPLKHANVHPRRRMHQVMMARALRGADGTTMGTAVGGGAAGGGAG